MEKIPVPSAEQLSTDTLEKEEPIIEGEREEMGDLYSVDNPPEGSQEDLQAKKTKAAFELGIDANKVSDVELAEEIVDRIEKDKAKEGKGILSRMPGVRAFVKAAILTVGLSMAGGILDRAIASDDEPNKPDSTLVDENNSSEEVDESNQYRANEKYTEAEMTKIRGYQHRVNDFLDTISERFYGKVEISNDQLFGFQQKAWDFGEYVVKNQGSDRDFVSGVRDLYEEDFAEQIKALAEVNKQAALEKAEQITSETVDINSIDDKWLWDNVDKIFRDGSDIYVVKSDFSRDMQMSSDKAGFKARASLSEAIGSSEIRGSELKRRDIRKNDQGLYETVVIMKLPLEQNMK